MRFSVNKFLFLIVFLIPLATVAVYEMFFATDRYQSIASIIITEERSTAPTVDLSLLGITGATSDKDALVLKEFIESRGMLSFLDSKLSMRNHFMKASIDPVTRLSNTASLEDFHEYFLDFMTVFYDTESKILRFSFQSFDRQYSQNLVKEILSRSQVFVDRLNEEVTREQLRFFDDQIVKSEKRLRESKDRLIKFQRKHKILTTESEGQTIIATIVALEQALATKESELNARLRVLDETAPQLVTLQLDIKALANQIAKAKDRLTGSTTSTSLSELDAAFRDIQLSLEFNTNIYKANLNALEQARLDAARRLKFLIVVSEPSLADESEFPDRPYIIATWAMVLLLVYFIVSLMVALIREHS